MFTPERIAIEKLDGTLVAERHAPRDSFAGHQMSTPWDPLHRAYFNGEALWTDLTTPLLLAMDGVLVEETEAWREGSEAWRVLRAYFPGSIETHCLVQDFFFGEDLLLRRHDYRVNIAGGFGASQLTSDDVEANGIRLPTKRRAYTRGPDRRPILAIRQRTPNEIALTLVLTAFTLIFLIVVIPLWLMGGSEIACIPTMFPPAIILSRSHVECSGSQLPFCLESKRNGRRR
jgi:hypothetical protein